MWEKLDERLERYEELERMMADHVIAADPARYSAIAKEYGSLGPIAQRCRKLKDLARQIDEAEQLLTDSELGAEAAAELDALRSRKQAIEEELTDLVLSGSEPEHKSVILEIRAGTGGDEAGLFARDLYEMYRRYGERSGWKFEVLDYSVSDHGGFKEMIASVAGRDAFRHLQFESGGHRVQRVPQTESQGRIHTSAATVAILPEPAEIEIKIRDEDIELETMRSSGPGGQHVNKTSSAVRLIHKPSAMVVECQEERSQHKNRAKAMRLLRSRLYDKARREQQDARDEARRTLIGSGDRSERIRTYNFPQNRCTDHRIGENFNLEEVIAGNLDKLVRAMLSFDREQRLAAFADSASRSGAKAS